MAADYMMEPDVVIDNDTTGKVMGAVAGFLPSSLAGLSGSLESKQSVVTLTLYDIRSGVQIGIAEGNASSTNFGAAVSAWVHALDAFWLKGKKVLILISSLAARKAPSRSARCSCTMSSVREGTGAEVHYEFGRDV